MLNFMVWCSLTLLAGLVAWRTRKKELEGIERVEKEVRKVPVSVKPGYYDLAYHAFNKNFGFQHDYNCICGEVFWSHNIDTGKTKKPL